jgi:ferredoxin
MGLIHVKDERACAGYLQCMSTRTIITIDEEKCNGCGLCIPNCPEGALQVIDGKARLISDLFCDGLGACIGHCPEGAITLTQREAEPYDERKVMVNIARQGANTIRAHLAHLDAHGEKELLAQALGYLAETRTAVPEGWEQGAAPAAPAAPARAAPSHGAPAAQAVVSELANWLIQLHLSSPMAPQFKGKDVLLSADCVAYAAPDFHSALLKGKVLAIACPKLDDGKDIYKEKITALIDHAQINTLTVLMMEVPCCRGLLALAQQAREAAHRKVPLKAVIVSIDGGTVLSEEWV